MSFPNNPPNFYFSYMCVYSFLIVVQSLSRFRLFATPWTVALQAFLSFLIPRILLRLMFIESMMPSNYHSLLPLSPPALNLSQHRGLFQWISSSHQVAKGLELQLQHQSFQWIFCLVLYLILKPKHGDGEEQASLAWCSLWGRKESDTTEWLKNNKTCMGQWC